MEEIAQERIILIKNNYAPLQNYREQTLTAKKINLEKYSAFALGFFGLIAFIVIAYIALADIFSYNPGAWSHKVGLLVGNVASILLLFFNSARNSLVLSHFLRLRGMTNDSNISNQYSVNQLDKSFLKLLQGKQIRFDAIFFVIIMFFGFYAYFLTVSDTTKFSESWDYMKFIIPLIYAFFIFRQLYYLNEIRNNIKEYENLVIH